MRHLTLALNISLIKIFCEKQKLFYCFCHNQGETLMIFVIQMTLLQIPVKYFAFRLTLLFLGNASLTRNRRGLKCENRLKNLEKIGQKSTIVFNSFTMTCCFRGFLYNVNLTLVNLHMDADIKENIVQLHSFILTGMIIIIVSVQCNLS